MFMSLGVEGFSNCCKNNRAGYRILQFFRFGNGAGHTCQSVGQYNLRTQGFQQITAFPRSWSPAWSVSNDIP